MSAADLAQLSGPTPLAALSTDLLGRFAFNVATRTVARPEDLVHYLPRILPDVVLRAITIVDLRQVCATVAFIDGSERAAVTGFLDDVWAAMMRQYPAGPRIDELLAAAGVLNLDREPWLAHWLDRLDQDAAVRHLADLLWTDGRLQDGRWRPVTDRETDRWDDVNAWLARPTTRQTMLQVAGRATDSELEQTLEDAAAVLSWTFPHRRRWLDRL